MSRNVNPRRKCKRCDRWLKTYNDHGYCPRCHYLKQFRPWEFDPVGYEAKTLAEAKVMRG